MFEMHGLHRGRGAMPHVPDKDIQELHKLGFDFVSTIPIAHGFHGSVFEGKCNKYAKKKAFPSEQTPDDNQLSREEVSIKGLPCAIKMCDIEQWKGQLWTEAKRLQELRHPNIVEVYLNINILPYRRPPEVETEKARRYFVLEFINGRTLREKLDGFSRDLTESEALQFIKQLTAGLHYLHSQKVVHNDLHLGNIMLSKEKGKLEVLKIVDFGSTRELYHPMISRNDIQMFGFHFARILQRSNFTRKELLDKLTSLSDDINHSQNYTSMDQIEEEISKIIPEEDPPMEVLSEETPPPRPQTTADQSQTERPKTFNAFRKWFRNK